MRVPGTQVLVHLPRRAGEAQVFPSGERGLEPLGVPSRNEVQ